MYNNFYNKQEKNLHMKIFKEFKEFISKGNVIDLAVGMIIGAAFTAIVTAIVTNIFTPLINVIPISDTGLQTVIREAVVKDGNVVTPALIIDWGAVISAIITFFITAIILFIIIKAINSIRSGGKKLSKKDKKKAAAEEVPAEPAPAPTTEELLAQIIELLKSNKTATDDTTEETKE